jgi:PleD family two-component response regulator
MSLSLFVMVISASDGEKIVKAVHDIQDFVSKIHMQSLKQRLITLYFRKQLPNVKF